MELKATLKDYTASEFQALVDRIWAVDLPKQDHDRLINHFDQIVGHPQGANLLFYSEDEFISNSPELVVFNVKDWHRKRGMAAFKGQQSPVATQPVARLSPAAWNLSEVQKLTADLALSEQSLRAAFGVFEQRIKYQHDQQHVQTNVAELETNIRVLELAQDETLMAFNTFKFWKMRVELVNTSAQNNLSYARSEHAVWSSIAQQTNAIGARYIAQLTDLTQRYRTLHDEAEALLILAQEHLIGLRTLTGAGPAHAACVVTGSLFNVDKLPAVLLVDEPSALLAVQQKVLQKSIRAAVGEFTWQNNSGEPESREKCAAVLQFEFSSRADTQVFGLSVPLAELVVIEGQNWQNLAAIRAEVDVPLRMSSATIAAKPGMSMGLRELKSLSHVYVTPFQGGEPISGVRVRAARQGEHPDSFSFIADGVAPITVSWPVPDPLDASAPMVSTTPRRLGFVHSLEVPLLEPLIDKENLHFDDYIVVFPVDSGLDPVYVMFRNRREYPI